MKRILAAVLLFLPALLAADSPITPKDFIKFTYPGDIAVAPDGNRVAYTVRHADLEKSEWQTHLWLYDVSQANRRQLTFSGADNYSPAWSPDGNWLTFLSERDPYREPDDRVSESTQLWVLPIDGGEARQWTVSRTSIRDYQWLPGGNEIIFLADSPKPDSIFDRRERLEDRGMDEIVRDSVRTKKTFYLLNVHSGESREIGTIDPGVREFDIGPDGRWIVYETNYTGEYNDAQHYDLWTLNIAGGDTTQLTDFPGPETDPRFSPDGEYIAYLNQTTPDIEFAQTDLARCRFRPGRAAADTSTLTLDYDLAVTDYLWIDQDRLALEIADSTETPIVELRPNRKTNRYLRLTPEVGNVSDVEFQPGTQESLFYRWEDATHLPEIARYHDGNHSILTDYSSQLDTFVTGTIRKYTWTSTDGQEIEGLLFLPPDFEENKQYPLILTVHGGPYSRFRQEFAQYYLPQMYTGDGYIVFAPNPRGSSGYSDAFGKAIWHEVGGHMGGIDYRDIMAGVDALIRDGYVDSARMGVTGGSYGGYLTNWIISQNNRFEAAVSMYGIFSLFTDWSNSWQPAWEKMYLGLYYWEQPITEQHPYVKYSPAFHVKNIRTPTLIMHGTNDKYTNLSNSQEMYQALKTLEREVKFVVYPGEGHGLSGEPSHRLDVLRRAKHWFDEHLRK